MRMDVSGFVLRGAHLVGREYPVDLGIRDGGFVPTEECVGSTELDLKGSLLIPGLVDAHMHLDKAFALESGMQPGVSLADAIKNYYSWREEITPEQIYKNALRTAKQALLNGTTALRTHTTVDLSVGMSWLEGLLRVKNDLSRQQTIQIVVFPDTVELLEGKARVLLRHALELGADLMGGAPLHCADPKRAIDLLYEIAGEAGCDLDMHIDETDDPSANTLEYLAERKIALGFTGKVVAGHCTSLSAKGEAKAQNVIDKVAQAGLYIITLPFCNMYLMGRNDRGLIRRGLTRVRELLDAGVKVCYASDNIRDAFNPFGDANMLQQALVCALALQFGSNAELELLLKMGTEYPAEAMGLEVNQIRVGDPATCVVLDAPDWGSALARQARCCYVFQQGELVAETSSETQLYL